jgi:hypothetical protein
MNSTTLGSSSATRMRRRRARSAEVGVLIVDLGPGSNREWQAAEGFELHF